MSWQPPAHSPLSLGALAGAARVWLTGVDPRADLERLLRREYDAERVVLTASGTHALQLALEGAREAGPGARVALPAFSCFDLVTAAVGAGTEMVFYDLDPETLEPDWPSFRRALDTPGLRAVVAAPLFGRPFPWDRIRGAAEAAGVSLIEDAAQGIGSSWRGRPAGSLGSASVLSFGRGKGWTGGGGGALLLRGDAVSWTISERADPPPAAPLLGRSAAQWLLGRPALYGLPSRIPALGLGETPYHPPTRPAGLSRVSAGLALATRAAALQAADVRRANARALLEALGPGSEGEAGSAWDPGCSYLRLPVRLPAGMDTFADPARALRLGIIASYPRPLPHVSAARARSVASTRDGGWPGAETLARELVTLPTHGFLTASDRDHIAGELGPLDSILLGRPRP